ncbi:MAG: O-antigen ligase family protein, partial [Actinomycetes bacterium]
PFWAAFFTWTAAAAVVGLLAGHQPKLVLGEGSMIINVGGMMLLVAGVPASEYVSSRLFARFIQTAAVVSAGLFVLDSVGFRWSNNSIPDLPFYRFGGFGADAATLFSGLGVIALVLGLARPRHLGSRAALIIPGLVLILSHLASAQRAARLGLYVTVLLILVIACLPTARRRLGFTPRQVSIAGAAALAIVCAAVFLPAVVSANAPKVNLTSSAKDFSATSRQGSIDSRFNQWNVVRTRIFEKPLVGEGLGGTFVSYSEGHKMLVEGDISHNIALDLLRRTGVVGVALALSALLAVLAQTISVWRNHPSTQIAALGAAAGTLIAGLLAKGMVESIFEKDRIAVFLGLTLGLAISAWLSWGRRPDVPTTPGAVPAPRHLSPSR